MRITRREFLQRGTGIAAAGAMLPAMGNWAWPGQGSGRRPPGRSLIVVELNGGNDALNTAIPIDQEAYYAARPSLAVPRWQALQVDASTALHPAASELYELYCRGHVAIVKGVGCEPASRSHFRSMEIWHRGGLEREGSAGWLGSWAGSWRGRMESATLVYWGSDPPEMMVGRGLQPLGLEPVQNPICNVFPGGQFGCALVQFARLIRRSQEAGAYYVSLAGFDTHARQADSHAALLRTLSQGIGAFMHEMQLCGCQKRVLVMVFSEFGRRLRENSSAGTDHGTAGVMLFVGGAVAGGVYGSYGDLNEAQESDLPVKVDFRDCYASVLRWLSGRERDGLFQPLGRAVLL